MPNAAIFSWFHQLNAAIRSHNIRHWLFFSLLKVINKNYTTRIPKNWRYDLSSRWNCLHLLWNRFSPFSSLFWLFSRLKREMFHLWIWIDAKTRLYYGETLSNILVPCEQTWHYLAHSFSLSKFLVNMRCTVLFAMSTMCASWHTFSLRSSNVIFFTIFGAVTSFGRTLQCSPWQVIWPRLNSAT